MFEPCPEWIFTLHPPQSVKPGNVKVRLSFFSRMNQPRMFLALAAVLWTTTYSAFASLAHRDDARDRQDLRELDARLGSARRGERECHDGKESGKWFHDLNLGAEAAVVDCYLPRP